MKIEVLAYPPSINNYLKRKSDGGVYKSSEARKFEKLFCLAAYKAGVPKYRPSDHLYCRIWLYPPDERRRDIDNAAKIVLDSAQKIGWVWDDCQIDELHTKRCENREGGACEVEIVLIERE